MDKRKLVNESNDEMEVSPDDSGHAQQVKSEESGDDSTTHDNPFKPDALEHQQLPSDILAETFPPPVTNAPSSALALQSSSDASAGHDSIKSSRPVLDRSDASGGNVIRSDGSPIKDGGNVDSAMPPESSSDGSPNRRESGSRQEAPRPSSAKLTKNEDMLLDYAGKYLFQIVKELIPGNKGESEFEKLQKLYYSLREEFSRENLDNMSKFTIRYQRSDLDEKDYTSCKKIEYFIFFISLKCLSFVAALPSSGTQFINAELAIVHYLKFRDMYEGSREFLMDIEAVDSQDKDSREDKELIRIYLLRMKIAFQFILMHIGEYVNQEFIDKNIEQFLQDDVKYLKRMIA